MSVWAVFRVKDEADIIAYTVAQMLEQVDHVLVADNGSTDGTIEILEGLSVELLHDADFAYYQAIAMTRLARYAGDNGAEWVISADSDEWWYSPFGRIADILSEHEGAVATAEVYDHRCTDRDPEGSPLERMGWRTLNPLPLHKIAARPVLPVTITQGNHSALYPTLEPLHGQLVVRHFPLRSPEQMIRKARNGAAAYAATELPEEVGQHWRGWGRLSDEQIAEVFREFYFSTDPERDNLTFDPVVGCSGELLNAVARS